MGFHGLFFFSSSIPLSTRQAFSSLTLSPFCTRGPGVPRLDTSEFAGNCHPFSARTVVSLGPSPWLTFSQGCWCVPSRDHILLTHRNLLGLPGSRSHVEGNVFLRYHQPAALCAKYSRELGAGPSLHFTLEHTFASLLGRTSTAVSIWGVS